MMRNVLFVMLCLILCCQNLTSQVLGQDKTGFSTILQPSASFNLDVANNVATLDFYQINSYPFTFSENSTQRTYDSEGECYHKWGSDISSLQNCLEHSWRNQQRAHANSANENFFWGIDLKGTSSNGVSVIFNNEKISSAGQISLTLGHLWSRMKYDYNMLSEYTRAYILDKQGEKSTKEKELIIAIEQEVQKLVDKEIINDHQSNLLLSFDNTDKNSLIDNLEKTKNKLVPININREKFREDYTTIQNQIDALEDVISLLNTGALETVAYTNAKTNNEEQAIITSLTKLKTTKREVIRAIEKEPLKPLFDSTTSNIPELVSDIRVANKWKETKNKIEIIIEDLSVTYTLKKAHFDNFQRTYQKNLVKAYDDYILYLKAETNNNSESYQELKDNSVFYNRHLLYIKSSFLASSFKLDRGDSLTTVSDRFIDRNEQGYRLEAGYTGQYRTYNYIGFSTALSGTNNMTALKTTTYKTQTIDTTITPNLTTNSEFKALSGTFDRFIQYELNFDYVRLLPLINNSGTLKQNNKEKGSLLLSLNPYIRHRFYDRSETLKPNTSLGFGTYAFNTASGSIAGGIFIQADDVFNVNRDRPVNFTKQITFGIVFKAAIKSFNPKDN